MWSTDLEHSFFRGIDWFKVSVMILTVHVLSYIFPPSKSSVSSPFVCGDPRSHHLYVGTPGAIICMWRPQQHLPPLLNSWSTRKLWGTTGLTTETNCLFYITNHLYLVHWCQKIFKCNVIVIVTWIMTWQGSWGGGVGCGMVGVGGGWWRGGVGGGWVEVNVSWQATLQTMLKVFYLSG